MRMILKFRLPWKQLRGSRPRRQALRSVLFARVDTWKSCFVHIKRKGPARRLPRRRRMAQVRSSCLHGRGAEFARAPPCCPAEKKREIDTLAFVAPLATFGGVARNAPPSGPPREWSSRSGLHPALAVCLAAAGGRSPVPARMQACGASSSTAPRTWRGPLPGARSPRGARPRAPQPPASPSAWSSGGSSSGGSSSGGPRGGRPGANALGLRRAPRRPWRSGARSLGAGASSTAPGCAPGRLRRDRTRGARRGSAAACPGAIAGAPPSRRP
jgi:hypothetical protein